MNKHPDQDNTFASPVLQRPLSLDADPVRLSVGIENVADLIIDLGAAPAAGT